MNTRKMFVWGATLLFVGCLSSVRLFGETTMKITCTPGEICHTESKKTGGTWTPNNFPTFTISATGKKNINGEVYVVYQVPNTAPVPNFTVGGKTPVIVTTWDSTTQSKTSRLGAIGFSKNQTKGTSDPSMMSQLSQANGVTTGVTGFTIYVFDLGPMVNGVGPGVLTAGAYAGLTAAGLPVGTVIYTYMTAKPCLPSDAKCSVINSSPNSQALTIGPSPEPASMALFGSGLLALGGFLRRRFVNAG